MEYLNDKMDFWARRAEEEGTTNHHREQTESDGDEVVLTTTTRRKILSSSPSPPATMVVNNDEEDSSSTAGQSDSPCHADNNANDDDEDQDSLIDYTDDDDDDATASASSSSSSLSTIEGSDDEWFKHCQTYPQSSRHDQEDDADAEEGETRPAYYGNVVYQSRHHDPHYNNDYYGDGYEQFERSEEDEEDQADYFDLPDDRESAGPRRFRNSPVVGGSGDDDCYQHDRDRNEDFFENCYAAYYGEDEEEDNGCKADGGEDREVGRYPPGGSEPTLPFALPKPRSWNPLAIGGGGDDYENNQALSGDEENNLDDDNDGTTSPPPSLATTLLTLEALAEAKRTHFREDLPWNYDAKALRRFGRKPREVVLREIKVLKEQIATESASST